MGFTFAFISSLLVASAVLAQYTTQPLAGVRVENVSAKFGTIDVTFRVPDLSCTQGRAYVGVTIDDASTCGGAIEAGVELGCASTTVADGPTYRAYSRSYPSDEVYYDNVTISKGDEVFIWISALLSGEGVYLLVIDKTNNDTTDVVDVHPQLCQKSVSWFIRASQQPGGFLYPIPEFDTFALYNVVAWDVNQEYGPKEGKSQDMSDKNGDQWVKAVSGDNKDITFTYTMLSNDALPGS